MAYYKIYNRTTDNLHVVVNNWIGRRCISTAISIPASGMVDMLPIAGTIDNCKLVCGLRDWELRGIIKIDYRE
jgi:hypothetical protein